MKPYTLLAAAAVFGVVPLGTASGRDASARGRGDIPAATVTGQPQDCIPINHIRETRVRDDSTIDFIGNGRGEMWRVTLPNPCPSLKAENRFSYETSLSQLCSTDIITVLYDYGGGATGLTRGASCGLSQFTPIALAR
jgi:hypothetical protein